MGKRVLIVGGVAGGASCAARLRRLDEEAEIVLFDRGPHVSFANCGLPYFVGDVIADERNAAGRLARALPRSASTSRCAPGTRCTAIDRAAQTIRVRDLDAGRRTSATSPTTRWCSRPGAAPIRPPLPGIDLPGIFAVRTIPDSRAHPRLDRGAAGRRARWWSAAASSASRWPRISPTAACGDDPGEAAAGDAAARLRRWPHRCTSTCAAEGVHAASRRRAGAASRPRRPAVGSPARTESGARLDADLVILSIGVRPETALAQAAGLPLGARGGIVVDGRDAHRRSAHLGGRRRRRGDRRAHRPGGRSCRSPVRPIARAASRRSRSAAGARLPRRAGDRRRRRLRPHRRHHGRQREGPAPRRRHRLREGVPPSRPPRRLLPGRQADPPQAALLARPTAASSAPRRSDWRASRSASTSSPWPSRWAATVHDLAEAELCYAPQFGGAKDPVNLAGHDRRQPPRRPHAAGRLERRSTRGDALLVDVREPDEFAAGHIPGALNLPLSQLRERYAELPRDRRPDALLRRRPARLLRDALPHAERLRRRQPVGRLHDLLALRGAGLLPPAQA